MRELTTDAKFDLDGRPPLGEAIPLGLQHVLAMFVGNIVPMMIVAQVQGLSPSEATLLLQAAMFGASIATLLQVFPISFGKGQRLGAGLPVFMGLTYTFLPTCIAVASSSSLAVIFGAQIIGSVFSIFFGMGLKKIRRFFPTIVTGSIILAIGISLFPMALENMAGGADSAAFGSYANWFVGVIVTVTILVFTTKGRGLVKDAAILIGIMVGYAVSLLFGMIDFSAVGIAPWFALPKPLAFGLEFQLDIVVLFSLMFLINSVEMIGDYSTSSVGGLGREATDVELSGGIIGNGITSIIAAIFNCFPTGTYSQNSGIVALNKVVSRFVFGVGALILLAASLMPKLGAVISTIPFPVIGGATLVVFGMISMSGVSLIASEPIDQRAMLIAGLSVGIGVALVVVPETLAQFPSIFRMFFGESSVVITAVIAFVLNLVLPKSEKELVTEVAEVEV